MELQQEYESLVKEFKNQQRAARAGRNGSKVRPGRALAAGTVVGGCLSMPIGFKAILVRGVLVV